MTEEEWLACSDPTPMLKSPQGKTSERKLRLFFCACCRRIGSLIVPKDCRRAVEMGEQLADSLLSDRQRKALWSSVRYIADSSENRGLNRSALSYAAWASLVCIQKTLARKGFNGLEAAFAAAWAESGGHPSNANLIGEATYARERAAQSALLRDIFGNPFRPIAINLIWLTPPVTNLATIAYEERNLPSGELDTARLAILADALEDAGCDDLEILGHLRSPRPHVRGCFGLDLLLRKE